MMKLNNSGANMFLECPKKYRLHYIDNIKPVVEADALHHGTLFHLGMENRCLPGELDALPIDKQAMLQGMIEIALERFDAPLKTEMLLSAKVTDDITMFGTIDEILPGGYISDFKTAASKVDIDNYRLQLIKYVWLANQNGYDIKGAKVRVAYKSKLRKKVSENVDEYANRIYRDYIENPDKYLEEYELTFTDAEIEAEIENFIEIAELMRNAKTYPKNFKSCNNYSGCQYKAMCYNLVNHEYLYKKGE